MSVQLTSTSLQRLAAMCRESRKINLRLKFAFVAIFTEIYFGRLHRSTRFQISTELRYFQFLPVKMNQENQISESWEDIDESEVS